MIVRGHTDEHAAGVLAFPGGKVEAEVGTDNVLESAVRREVLEETGVTVSAELEYVRSTAFALPDGTPVVDVLFLGSYLIGEPHIASSNEVADIGWMTADEILENDRTPSWLVDQVRAVRQHRSRTIDAEPG